MVFQELFNHLLIGITVACVFVIRQLILMGDVLK